MGPGTNYATRTCGGRLSTRKGDGFPGPISSAYLSATEGTGSSDA